MGKLPVIRTLTTLAHDCRRTELFQGELLAALKIVQRGDLPLRDLIGAFAGEIGQTQFLPSSYIKYGVDFDGDGRVDLRHTVPDVLASTANLLHTNGFKMGAPYERRHRKFRSHARMEPRHDLPQDHRVFRGSAGGAVSENVSSSLRKQGPITTVVLLVVQKPATTRAQPRGLRRMGPCFRRDDSGKKVA